MHRPLVEKIPGLERMVVNRVTRDGFGDDESEFVLITELHYPDRDRFETAIRSDENRTAVRDLMSFARDLVTVVIAESDG